MTTKIANSGAVKFEKLMALVKEINYLHEQSEKSVDKTEQYYRTMGKKIEDAKARNSALKKSEGKLPWADFCDKYFKFSDSKANLILQITDGRKSLKDTREKTRKAMRKSRKKSAHKKSPSRDGENGGSAVAATESACDYNPEDPAQVAEPGDTPEMIRRRIFLYRASESLRHAKENGFDEAAPSEINKQIISAAQAAAEAWSDLASSLVARQKRKKAA